MDAIYWDISFMGGPKDNEEFIEDMNERLKDIELGIVKTIPAEQVFNKLGLKAPENIDGCKVAFSPEVVAQLGLNPDNFEGVDISNEE